MKFGCTVSDHGTFWPRRQGSRRRSPRSFAARQGGGSLLSPKGLALTVQCFTQSATTLSSGKAISQSGVEKPQAGCDFTCSQAP